MTKREKAEALVSDNFACTKRSVFAWFCEDCPIGDRMDGDKCCAGGKASEAAEVWLSSQQGGR